MSERVQRCQRLMQSLYRVAARPAHCFQPVLLPAEPGGSAGEPLRPDEHYFQVRISELFLSYRQQWLSNYDPLLVVISEFIYGSQTVVLPVVLGPLLLGRQMRKTAGGMLFLDSRAAGWHPYRGGPLNISAMLCRVRCESQTRSQVRLIERIAGALDFATGLDTYLHLADVVLDGLENLSSTGRLVPWLGVRFSSGQAGTAGAGAHLPEYGALIDIPTPELHTDTLHVRDGRLLSGTIPAAAQPFRQADYMLVQLARTDQREDFQALPFYDLYRRIMREAALADDDSWLRARANRLALLDSLVQSLDLTPVQATALHAAAGADMQRLRQQARSRQTQHAIP
jgi:hypothetical protein